MELNVVERLRTFAASARRVFVIAKKPTWQEFQTMGKVTGIGILIIALIAYVVYLIFAFTPLG